MKNSRVIEYLAALILFCSGLPLAADDRVRAEVGWLSTLIHGQIPSRPLSTHRRLRDILTVVSRITVQVIRRTGRRWLATLRG